MYSIRPMSKEDLEGVCGIENAIFSLPWSEKSFADACEKEDNIYLVCEYDGVIAGYCGMWTVLGEGNITNMAVAEAYRKKGIARQLMEAVHREARRKDVNTFFLEVRQSNTAAISLYNAMGYTQIGIRKRFYEKPVEDALVMSKNDYV